MSIEVGSKLQGKVTGITNFGAFVELPEGQTGLVHISEVADKYVEDIREVLEVGNEVTVKVLQVGDDGKIGLSIRKAVDRPKTTRSPKPPKGRRPRKDLTFEDKMSKFLKDSEDRLSTLKKQTESKRGGRGARRG
ncbi:RNA-binding protein S1 [Pullulanibacillus camelliae]|uniref:RNA-binding protein S1 n=1 Tax=Pullulanibacillus camelliae TaxID=1707096 RepID=A0A8J2YN94_9BACL|nr:S1 domain-containing RNA-binding protein [Pullulanibacillus camelliae]GGE54111.1 RNA-binding protein S1 [Pullulanibacillus camelliae]